MPASVGLIMVGRLYKGKPFEFTKVLKYFEITKYILDY